MYKLLFNFIMRLWSVYICIVEIQLITPGFHFGIAFELLAYEQ